MSQIVEFRAQVERFAEGSFTARLVPFGEKAPYGSGTVEFRRGSLRSSGAVPLTVDHGDSVLDRVGVMSSFTETDTGAYGAFQLSDTEAGRTLRTLLMDGAVTDISVGVRVDNDDSGVMFGELDHVSLVGAGRFASDGIKNPSKVLSVHSEKEPPVADTETTAPVVTFDDSELKEEIVRLSDTIEEVRSELPGKTANFSGIEIMAAMTRKAGGLQIANHALADVIGDLGALDASAVVPDAYWGAGLQMKNDRRRPLFVTAGSAPFPTAGNNLEVPAESQTALVGPRGAEKSAIPSQAWQATLRTFPIEWFAGGADVSLEIISQSDPAILGLVLGSLLNSYADATEQAATTFVEGAATATGGPLVTTSYAGLVADLITTSDMIEDVTGMPGNICGVTSAQWIAILGMVDGGDRRQFSIINAQNADGTGSLTTRGIDIGGIFVYRAPKVTAAVQYNSDSYKNGEKSPMQVASDNVELMGRDIGVLGGVVQVDWAGGIFKYAV